MVGQASSRESGLGPPGGDSQEVASTVHQSTSIMNLATAHGALGMLSTQDSKLITRVGPGTPMGNLLREYWVPALLARELPSPDGDPLRY